MMAIEDVRDLPPVSSIVQSADVFVFFPIYLVKKYDPLRLYFPPDPIDLGRLRERRRFDRERSENGGA